MQIGGVGSALESHSSSHRVTGCMHDHEEGDKKPGGMKALHTVETANASQAAETEAPVGLNLFQELLSIGKRLWGRLWGNDSAGNGTAAGSETAKISGAEGAAARNGAQISAATLQTSQAVLQNNPYFTPASAPGEAKTSFIQKVRVKFRDLTGQLTKRFAGRFSHTFSGRKELDSKGRQPREDLRKHSRYREDGLEINCVLTDDSYLMDSYDRKGEYSRLTTEYKK